MASRTKRRIEADIMAPPVEQLRDGAFTVETVHDRTANGALCLKGVAYRRKPMIDILAAVGLITEAQHKALQHYRHHADIADRSLIRDSLCLQRGGHGDGVAVTTLNALRLVGDVEAACGTLRDILRAVVVEDRSLSQWAIDRAGALETRRERKGRVVYSLEPRQMALKVARQEIRMAAIRVEAELAGGSRCG